MVPCLSNVVATDLLASLRCVALCCVVFASSSSLIQGGDVRVSCCWPLADYFRVATARRHHARHHQQPTAQLDVTLPSSTVRPPSTVPSTLLLFRRRRRRRRRRHTTTATATVVVVVVDEQTCGVSAVLCCGVVVLFLSSERTVDGSGGGDAGDDDDHEGPCAPCGSQKCTAFPRTTRDPRGGIYECMVCSDDTEKRWWFTR
mgnify:CR=1 FL=1